METDTSNTAAPSVEVPRLVRPLRTDEEIVAQTDKLAFTLALLAGYAFDADYKFHLHTRLASCPMPRQAQYWEMAQQAQLLLTDTDPDDAVDNLDWANDQAQQRATNDAPSTEDATGALAAAPCSATLGLRADPCVEFEHGGVRHRGQSSDSVISVEDGIATYLAHQHARGRDLSVTADELLKAHETLVSVGDSLKLGMRVSEDMVLKQSAYRALCDWSEANRREGKFTPFPAQLRDYLYPELQKESVPRSASGGSELSGERPSDTTDDRTQPDVENLVRHIAENPSGSEGAHTTPNDKAQAPAGPQ